MQSLFETVKLDDIRQAAKNIRRKLASLDFPIEITHSTALDIAAAAFGYNNYNIARGKLT